MSNIAAEFIPNSLGLLDKTVSKMRSLASLAPKSYSARGTAASTEVSACFCVTTLLTRFQRAAFRSREAATNVRGLAIILRGRCSR